MKKMFLLLFALCLAFCLAVSAGAEEATAKWTDGITNADQPVLDTTTNVMTVKTARQLAWIAWKANQGNNLSSYTIELANDIDLAGKIWAPIDGFSGVLDGKGHTIRNMKTELGGFCNVMNGKLRNLFFENVDCTLGANTGILCSAHSFSVENCGAVGTVSFASNGYSILDGGWISASYGSQSHNCYAAVTVGDDIVGEYITNGGVYQTKMTEEEIKSEAFLSKLHVLMEDVWDWKTGADGFPVLDPTSSRSWCNNTEEVAPKNGTYYVETEEELAYIAKLVNSGNTLEGSKVVLMADLDLSGKYWTPIGNYPNAFGGNFDGQGHGITGLTVGSPENRHDVGGGLFGVVANATVTAVRMEDVAVYAYEAGGLIGSMVQGTASGVTDCSVTGTVAGCGAGGLIGGSLHTGSTMRRCWAACEVIGTDIGGPSGAGGLLGYAWGNFDIENCYAIGAVSGIYGVGGLVGDFAGTITNCYAACDVDGINEEPGMILGRSNANTANLPAGCYWSSDNVASIDGIARPAVGIGGGYTGTDATQGKTLAQLRQQSTYAGWDFWSVWAIDPAINGGLPYLRSFGAKPEVPMTGLTISEDTVRLKTGENWWLTATVRPINATTKLTWTSSAPQVAAVSENGKITALSAGTAVITVSGGRYTKTCTVTVTQRQVDEYTIDSLRLYSESNGALAGIPKGKFYAKATITKKEDAGSAVAMIVAYSASGQMLDSWFLEADVPVAATYSLGVWVNNADGKIGELKVFLLPALAVPTPLSEAKSVK